MRYFLSLIVIAMVTHSCIAQEADVENSETVRTLASLLESNYIFEDKAIEMKKLLLNNLNRGNYKNIDGPELAWKLQEDVRSVIDDKHLRIRPLGVNGSSNRRRIPHYQYAIGDPRILEDTIGYLEITGFQQPGRALEKSLGEKMKALEGVSALVIDMRNNGGGSPAGVALICSYFFAEEPVHLNSLYFRNRDTRRDFYTLEKLDGPRFPDTPLYVLTSDYTFSGGEEFTYNLKHLKRATIVGETTGGGAHPVDGHTIGNLRAIIPVGRAINPVTGSNWEGTGVEPHVRVDEEDALKTVLEMIANND